MKILIKYETIWFWMIIITPFVDTINGLLLFANGVSGVTDRVSIGAFYRIIVIMMMLYFVYKKGGCRSSILYIVCLMYFPVKAIMQGLIEGGLFSFLSYALKWIYPILLIEGFCTVYRNNPDKGKEHLNNIMNFFSWSFAALLLLEYCLGWGRETYYDAGFKGFFYSTNDISYCLTVGCIYQIFLFFKRHSIKHIVCIALNLTALIVLAAKSGFVFIVLALVYSLFYSGFFNRKKLMYAGILLILGVVGLTFIGNKFDSEIQEMMLRYRNMYEYSMARRSTFDGILAFLTSGRTPRIERFFEQLENVKPIMIHFFTGWVRPDNGTVIEMDFHDLLCQYGLIGLLILGTYYLKKFWQSKGNKEFKLIYLISMISAALGGHVISAALSGTVLAVITCFLCTGNMVKKEEGYVGI